jgi:hypothetical protein
MRLRHRTLSALCLIATSGALLAAVAAPSRALAQPGQVEDEVTKMAREQFLEGIKAYDAGQFEKARLHFLQAYALKRHPAVLLNLGQSELKTGEIEAAGNHLQQFLREHKDATEAQKNTAREGIEEAQRRTGFVVIVVDEDGAALSIDGQGVGTSPLLGPYFIKPGSHEAAATKHGKMVKGNFVAEKSRPATITLSFGMGATPAPSPVPSPDPSLVPLPPPGVAPSPYPQPGMMPFPQPGDFDTGPAPASDKDPITWFKNRPIAWVTVGVFGAGVVGMVVAGAVAGDASSAADKVQQQIQAEADRRDVEGKPCGPRESTGSLDEPGFSSACNTLRDNLDRYDTSLVAVGVLGGVAAVGLAATLVYYFVDTSGGSGSALMVTPTLGPDTQGLSVAGSF